MYENWFQLSKRPFGAAPQVADYYPSDQMESARKAIVRCLEGGGGPSILIGGPGSGKTTLCLKIREQYDGLARTGFFSCCGIRSRRELLQQILFAFGRPFNAVDEGELRISLTNFAQSQQEQDQGTATRAVLLIDDACDLPNEFFDELRSLSNLTHDGNWCVNLVLAGKSKLEELLARTGMESLNQRIASRNYLNKWNAMETAEYLQFQISRAGGDASAIFSQEAIEQIYAITDGLPRLINQVCDHAMIMAALGNVRQLDSLNIEESWADLQQLPPPSRKSIEPTTDHNEESMIEFGTLDGVEACTEPADPSSLTDETMESMASIEFGPLPGGEAVSDVPMERSVESAPQDGPTHDLRLSSESQNELVDRLDDIEREVSRVSNELEGESAAQAFPVEAPVAAESVEPLDEPEAPSISNPFLEIFDEEEIVFGTHNTLNNELVKRQPTVFTSGGEALIDVIRMVDQGPEPNEWELHDDVSGSRPAEETLSLELATSTFLNARFEPEIAEVNESGADFSESDFVFNYSAPITTEPIEAMEAIGPPAIASPEVVFDSAVEAPSVEHSDASHSADLSHCELVESVSEPVPDEGSPIFEFGPNDGICGSNVGATFEYLETIDVSSDALELSQVSESTQPLTEDGQTVLQQEVMTEENDTAPRKDAAQATASQCLDETSDRTELPNVSPTSADQAILCGQGFNKDLHQADSSASPGEDDDVSAYDEQQVEECLADTLETDGECSEDTRAVSEDDWEATRAAEPIEQTMILPHADIRPFSNNTRFGNSLDESDGEEGVEAETPEEAMPSTPEPAVPQEDVSRTTTEQNVANYSKLFSRLKSAGNE